MKAKLRYGLLLLVATAIFVLPACSTLPFEPKISEGKFRFENFKRVNKTRTFEYVSLMCLNNKTTKWQEPMQFEAGDQKLWVHARTYHQGIQNSKLEAFHRFDVNLNAGKSYMLNRDLDGDTMTIWIQEVKTGINVTEKITFELEIPAINEHNLRDLQCTEGTV